MTSKLGPKFKAIGSSIGSGISSAFKPIAARMGGFASPLEGSGSGVAAGMWGQRAKWLQNLGVNNRIPNAMNNETWKTLSSADLTSKVDPGAFGAKMASMDKLAFSRGLGKLLGGAMRAANKLPGNVAPGGAKVLGSGFRPATAGEASSMKGLFGSGGKGFGGAYDMSKMQNVAQDGKGIGWSDPGPMPKFTGPWQRLGYGSPPTPPGNQAFRFAVNHPGYAPGQGVQPWGPLQGRNFGSSINPGGLPPGFSKMSCFRAGFDSEISHMIWEREMEKQAALPWRQMIQGAGRMFGGAGRAVSRASDYIGKDFAGTENALSGSGLVGKIRNAAGTFSQSAREAFHGEAPGAYNLKPSEMFTTPPVAPAARPMKASENFTQKPVGSNMAPQPSATPGIGAGARDLRAENDLHLKGLQEAGIKLPNFPPERAGNPIGAAPTGAPPIGSGYWSDYGNPGVKSTAGSGYWNRFQNAIGGMDKDKWYTKALVGPGAAGMTPAMRGQVGAGRAGLAAGVGGLGLMNGGVNERENAKRRDMIRNQSRWGLAAGALMGGPDGVINSLYL